MQDGADTAWYARAVLADTPQHDDTTVAAACKLLIADPATDPETWFHARETLAIIEGRAA